MISHSHKSLAKSCLSIAMAGIMLIHDSHAATTDLATVPLVSAASANVKPNILFVLDDSGSMGLTYMPDDAGNFTNNYGYTSQQCNGIYYNPLTVYSPPVTSTGASFANASFTAAWTNGFTATGSDNLSTSFQPHSGATVEPAFYHTYAGTQTTERLKDYFATTSTFYKECNSNFGSTPGSAVFTKVVVPAAQYQNFANWYSYYRTRMLMMKTSSGRAFLGLDNRYRVGFATINNNNGSKFLNLSDFDAAQKVLWYNQLYTSTPGNSTPLRVALSTAGRLYGHKLTTYNGVAANDPIQYSCQQNFTILSTDGYWNGGVGKQLDGTTDIGDQDGSAERPFNDGGGTIVTTVTPSTTVVNNKTATSGIATIRTWTRTFTSLGAPTCSFRAAATSCVQDMGGTSNSSGQVRTWCMTDATGSNAQCSSAIGGGGIYGCRGSSNPTNLPASGSASACKTDTSGQQWCVYNNSVAGSSCTLALTGDNIYVCKAGNGSSVLTENQTYTQLKNVTTTTTTSASTTSTTTVVTTNGVSGIPTVTTGAPVNTNSTDTTINNDTGAPNAMTMWTTTSSSTSAACYSPSPATGGSAPTGGATTTTSAGTSSSLPTTTTTTSGTPTTTTATGPTVADTLADVAQYYYVNDLRTSALGNATGALGTVVTLNNVNSKAPDGASWQHMTTFTLGLGARGKMIFSPTYLTDTSGDFFSVKNGLLANSVTGACSWQSNGTVCNWPTPVHDTPEAVDDLWHAAVNGRGNYFAATDPTSLATGLGNALAGIEARDGTSSAATTSNPNVVQGDNFVFSSTFTTLEWDGELKRKQLDLTTGKESAVVDWSAQALLESNSARTIYTRAPGNGSDELKPFAWTSLTAAEKAYFGAAQIALLSQSCLAGPNCITVAAQMAAAGAPLVNFLTGSRTNEGSNTDPNKYFRQREHILGDIVNGEAVYVKASQFDFSDTGYSAFKAANASRLPTVYVEANDGMLHAFNADDAVAGGGQERWAYVPTFAMSGMYRLADKNYGLLHQFILDGTPTVSEVYFGSAWHTILVGGQNAGGRGYFALDITDPVNPKSLWEFSNSNLGYTYGKPEIAKLKDGTWVVMFGSGYNNVAPGDGVGRLFVLNAGTGAIIRTISTGVGDTTTPSGMTQIRAWVDNTASDNTTQRVYGGDLLGNVWRFDVNNDIGAAGYDAQLLITLVDAGGIGQPITSKPQLGDISGVAAVFVGTGRYLGATDFADTQQQSFYAIKDVLNSTTLGNPRLAATSFVKQTHITTTCPTGTPVTICTTGQIVRTSTNNIVNFSLNNGWYIDLPETGERANTDSDLQLGTLAFNTNTPKATDCAVGGTSFRYFLDYRTGASVSTAGSVVSVSLGNQLATRPVLVRLPNNTVVALTRLSTGETVTNAVPIGNPPGNTRRISWRELTND